MSSSRPLDQRIAIVTGASRGIGRATAVHLAELGATVAMNYRADEPRAQEAARAVAGVGPAPMVVRADLASAEECRRLVTAVLDAHGRLDIVVNNAAIQRIASITSMSDADWQDVIDVDLSAPFHVARAALPAMVQRATGHIVNVASASAFVAHPGISSYVAAKHGLIGLTRALAVETARKGVCVNAVAPGMTETDMIASLSEAQRGRLLDMVPMRRAADPREVAEMIGWIVTGARYSTGNVFHVGGGVVMA